MHITSPLLCPWRLLVCHQVMRRNAVVLTRIGGFLTAIIADWQLGKWDANIQR
jgi:hypothetical protein